jgi:hypothetical protein
MTCSATITSLHAHFADFASAPPRVSFVIATELWPTVTLECTAIVATVGNPVPSHASEKLTQQRPGWRPARER